LGRELITRKVRLLSLMGGSYKAYVRNGQTILPGGPSTNMRLDTASAQALFAKWPTPVVAAGDELGDRMPFPGKAVETDFRYVAHHPIAESYRFMVRTLYRAGETSSAPYDHKMTDEVALLYAARPDARYFEVSEPGTITVRPDGGTSFTPSPTGRHRFLRQDEGQRVRAQEAMTMMVTQPPAQAGR
jgi:purine nucleosidase